MFIILAFIVSLVLYTAAEADIYKYVDEEGVVCFTDLPFNRKAERLTKTDSLPAVKEPPSSRTERDFQSIVHDKAAKYALDPSLVHAVIKTESNGNPRAISPKGAMGLMQLMPMTANDLEVRNPFDPEENIDGGTRYLKYLIERFRGDLTLALAAYNAGPTTVEKTGAVPRIPETQGYVKKVLSLYNGRTVHPVNSPQTTFVSKSEAIYKVVTDDGAVLFTNSPVYKSNPRF